MKIRTISSKIVYLEQNDSVLKCNCIANSISVYLNPARNYRENATIIKVDSSANVVTIYPHGSETIDGSASVTLSAENDSKTLVPVDGGWAVSVDNPGNGRIERQGFGYNLDIGLRLWRAAIARVGYGSSNIDNLLFVGSSSVQSVGATASNGFVKRVGTDLATKYGDVGTGFVAAHLSAWTLVGWTTPANVYGIMKQARRTTVQNETATLSFSGTGIDVYMAASTTGNDFTMAIDGGAPQNYTTYQTSTDAAKKYSITGLTDGSHTLVITFTGTSGGITLIGACPIKGTNGVKVHAIGVSGSKIADSTPSNQLKAEIDIWTPALTVICYISNDFYEQTSLDSFKASNQILIDKAKEYGDCLLLPVGVRIDPSGYSDVIPQSKYNDALLDLAIENNVAYLDLFNRWGGSFSYAKNTLGFIYTDDVHQNDYGHQDITNALLNVLLEKR